MPNGIGIYSRGREELGLLDPSSEEKLKQRRRRNAKFRRRSVRALERKTDK